MGGYWTGHHQHHSGPPSCPFPFGDVWPCLSCVVRFCARERIKVSRNATKNCCSPSQHVKNGKSYKRCKLHLFGLVYSWSCVVFRGGRSLWGFNQVRLHCQGTIFVEHMLLL